MSNKLYTSIPAPRVPRNTFDRSRPNTFSMGFNKTYPTMCDEILPGDLFRVNMETFARLQPLIAPVMNNMKISNHFFYVPLRTLNRHFSEFMFNNRTGDYTDVLPYCELGDFYNAVEALSDIGKHEVAANVIRLIDFMGLPYKYSSNSISAAAFVNAWLADDDNENLKLSILRVNLCPFLAYTKIWSEYFRDENLQDDPFDFYNEDTGDDWFDWTGKITLNEDRAEAFCQLRPRAWAHDRFTSALPFAQRGPDVLLPIAGTADVTYKDGFLNGQQLPTTKIVKLQPDYTEAKEVMQLGTAATNAVHSVLAGPVRAVGAEEYKNAAFDPNGSLQVDFDNSDLTTTINAFRRAERLQRWYENSARGGVRPNEATLAHFGVKTPDSSLDRSEFLGGNMQPIVISEVAQTSESTQSSPQATLAGKGTSYKTAFGIKRYFTEHGFLFCFTSALVRANYWQGIPRMFSRMQRDEYYWPEFANLGEEPVYEKELYVNGFTQEDAVFGYVPRYSDYKSAVGECHGDMRSSLSFWTQTREFANAPQLNEEFMFANPSDSPFAVQGEFNDKIVVTHQFHVKASRLMPFYGVPTI